MSCFFTSHKHLLHSVPLRFVSQPSAASYNNQLPSSIQVDRPSVRHRQLALVMAPIPLKDQRRVCFFPHVDYSVLLFIKCVLLCLTIGNLESHPSSHSNSTCDRRWKELIEFFCWKFSLDKDVTYTSQLHKCSLPS